MKILHTWKMVIDSTEVVVDGLADDNNLIDVPRIDDNIFTAYGDEDFLMCSLFEGGDIADGAVLEYAIIKEDDGFWITWKDHVSADDDVHRYFDLVMHKHTKKAI